LYLLDYGETWGANKDSKLLKISYQWGNIAPVAKCSADKMAGGEPLTVLLSSEGSKDHEGEALSFEWRLHPGGRMFSTEAHAKLTLTAPGNYIAELRVRDEKGASASASVPLIAGNNAPQVRFIEPRDGDFFTPGKPLRYAVAVDDAEDGTSRDYEEVFEARTFVKAVFGRGDGRQEEAEPGLALMKQSDCFNCHAVEQRIVGPPLLEVANRYRGSNDAVELSVQRVIKGSSGVWSEVPMLPHESLNPDQIRMMVRWIFALEPGRRGGNVARGLSGEINVPKDDKLQSATLEASYSDNGRAPAGSLGGKAAVKLRSRRIEAELADEKQGAKVLGRFLAGGQD
jgi:cytochrome c